MYGVGVILVHAVLGYLVYRIINDCRKEKEHQKKALQALKDFDKNVRNNKNGEI